MPLKVGAKAAWIRSNGYDALISIPSSELVRVHHICLISSELNVPFHCERETYEFTLGIQRLRPLLSPCWSVRHGLEVDLIRDMGDKGSGVHHPGLAVRAGLRTSNEAGQQ